MRCLIIGQGIAGSVLAWTLKSRGVSVQLADLQRTNSSSRVAAGIINPVTGKRFVKSWRFDDFYPVAKAVYQGMEQQWGVRIWTDHTILRLLDTPQEANDWSARLGMEGYEQILGQGTTPGSWAGLVQAGAAVGEIKHAARVDFSALLHCQASEFQNSQDFQSGEISMAEAEQVAKEYDAVIFCEGAKGLNNPFFPNLPWQLSKGEALLLQLQSPPDFPLTEILKKHLLLAPLANGLVWAGSSYSWDFEDEQVTPAAQAMLEERLAALLSVPFDIVQRYAAIRPTVKDRRPFLGQSTVHPKMFIFNGLGTKGALLAPYWAGHLAEHVLFSADLDIEVDIRRFAGRL